MGWSRGGRRGRGSGRVGAWQNNSGKVGANRSVVAVVRGGVAQAVNSAAKSRCRRVAPCVNV